MFLGNTLAAATSGLNAIEQQIALVSQNVANASTPNYTKETLPLSNLATAGGPAGVRVGVATRTMNYQLQGDVFAAVGSQSGSDAMQTALAGIDQISGQPGSGQDLSSLFGNLQDAFSTLANDPSNGSQQEAVLSAAGAFVGGLNTLSTAIVQSRQAAQDTAAQDVVTLNQTLHSVGQLSSQIIAAKASGESTADLENQRDGELQTLAQLAGAKFINQPSGDVEVIAGNSVLPTRATSGPFSLAATNISAATPAASLPILQLNGVAVTGLGGEIGANLTLRDTTLPGLQSQVDGFAQSVAASFQGQGLTLFTDPSGAVPAAGTAGFASTIQVSTTVQASPTIVRDGDGSTTPGPAGDTTLINKVLSNVFAGGATGLPEQATSLLAGFAQAATQAQGTATTNSAVLKGLQNRLSTETGVSVDSEMSQLVQLQASYGANAKVVEAVQKMWADLYGAMP